MSPSARTLIAAALAALLAPRAALADPAQKAVAAGAGEAQAARLNDEATALYEHGRYRDAIARLEAARELDPKAKDLVYNLAVIHEKLGDLDDAIDLYRRALAMENDPRGQDRFRAILRRLEGVRREAAPARDGAGAGPGGATFAAAPPPPPAAARPPASRWVIASASVAGGTLVLGTIFGVSAMAQNPGPEARTGAGVTIGELKADAAAAHRSAVLADVSFAISAASAATALLLYFVAPRAAVSAGHAGPRITFGVTQPPALSAVSRFALEPPGAAVLVSF